MQMLSSSGRRWRRMPAAQDDVMGKPEPLVTDLGRWQVVRDQALTRRSVRHGVQNAVESVQRLAGEYI